MGGVGRIAVTGLALGPGMDEAVVTADADAVEAAMVENGIVQVTLRSEGTGQDGLRIEIRLSTDDAIDAGFALLQAAGVEVTDEDTGHEGIDLVSASVIRVCV